MARRFFTADFHLGMPEVIKYESRPFIDADDMNKKLMAMCQEIATPYDTIVHVGDLACYSSNGSGLKINPQTYVKQLDATFVNIRGNHDLTNKVKSLCSSMRTNLGKYMDVSISHYPSMDPKSVGSWMPGDIHVCGHVHKKWKHCLDIDNKVLNINVGVDAWDYKIVSEEELINYIDNIMRMDTSQIFKVSMKSRTTRNV